MSIENTNTGCTNTPRPSDLDPKKGKKPRLLTGAPLINALKGIIDLPRPTNVKDNELRKVLNKHLRYIDKKTGKYSYNTSFCNLIIATYKRFLVKNKDSNVLPTYDDLFDFILGETDTAEDLVTQAKIVKWFATGCTGYYPLIQHKFSRHIALHKEQIRRGTSDVMSKDGTPLSGTELLRWLNRCPTSISDSSYFFDKFMYYLPGFVVEV